MPLHLAHAIKSTLGQISFEIGFELSLNWHFWSEFLGSYQIVTTKSIKLDPNLIEIFKLGRNWSKSMENDQKSDWFWHFWLISTIFELLMNLYWYFNQKEIENDKFKLKLYQNRNRRFDLILEVWIGLKLMIKFGRLGIWIDDDSILEA